MYRTAAGTAEPRPVCVIHPAGIMRVACASPAPHASFHQPPASWQRPRWSWIASPAESQFDPFFLRSRTISPTNGALRA